MTGYRPEIDGLRAVAVLPVILFHAGIAGFSGGFVGVDLFFVISGYLITSIIHSELEDGRFSLLRFLERRARRILPALFLVVSVSTVFAWIFMLPEWLESYSWSVLSVLGFGSNFYFWKTVDYFGTPSDLIPLLHTWSLAVEEQFYILFPPFMMLLAWLGLGRRHVLVVLGTGAIASFALCLWAVERSPSANFFFPVTRAWELLAGSCLALIRYKRKIPPNGPLALLGVVMIAVAAVGFGKTTPFPSVWALLPVVGTLLILGFGHASTWVGRVLAMRGPVAIGLISYGAYLWHQPVFALARLRLGEDPGAAIMLALAVASIGLAALSWRVLENPIRRRSGWAARRNRGLVAGAGACVLVLAVTATIGGLSGGVPQRFTPEQQRILEVSNVFERLLEEHDRRQCFIDGRERVRLLEGNGCLKQIGKRDVVLYGNSHAAHLIFGLDHELARREDGGVRMFTAASCRPWIDSGTSRRCAEVHETFLNRMAQEPSLRVIIAMNWHAPYWELGDGVFEAHIRTLTGALIDMGHRVTLVGRLPHIAGIGGWRGAVARSPDVPANLSLPSEDIAPVNALLARIADSLGADFVDPSPALCPDGLSACAIIREGVLLYSDGGHLSVAGSHLVVSTTMGGDILK
jgi:peptidoglycan/LPS O-acetylase OafA/YrhL